jgi:hypothetical protein
MSLVVQVIIRKGLAIVPLVVLEGGPNRNLLRLVREAYKQVALKRMLKALEDLLDRSS